MLDCKKCAERANNLIQMLVEQRDKCASKAAELAATDSQQAKVAITLLNRLSAWENGGFPGVVDMPQKIVAEWRKATATVC